MFILFGIFKEIYTVTKFEVRHGLTQTKRGANRKEEEKREPMKKVSVKQRSSVYQAYPLAGPGSEGDGGRAIPHWARKMNTKSRAITNLHRKTTPTKKTRNQQIKCLCQRRFFQETFPKISSQNSNISIR